MPLELLAALLDPEPPECAVRAGLPRACDGRAWLLARTCEGRDWLADLTCADLTCAGLAWLADLTCAGLAWLLDLTCAGRNWLLAFTCAGRDCNDRACDGRAFLDWLGFAVASCCGFSAPRSRNLISAGRVWLERAPCASFGVEPG